MYWLMLCPNMTENLLTGTVSHHQTKMNQCLVELNTVLYMIKTGYGHNRMMTVQKPCKLQIYIRTRGLQID